MDGWDSAVGCSPAARRLLTISERPMRERSAGTAMVAGGASSGGGSLVTKRTRTWSEGSASMAAAADGRTAFGVEVVVVGVAAAGRVGEGFCCWEFELGVYSVRVSEMLAPVSGRRRGVPFFFDTPLCRLFFYFLTSPFVLFN